MNMRHRKKPLVALAMCSPGREEGGLDRPLRCCLSPAPRLQIAEPAAARTYTHKHVHTNATPSMTSSTQTPNPPKNKFRNLNLPRFLSSRGSRPPPLVLCVWCVTSLSGWLWPFLSACGLVP